MVYMFLFILQNFQSYYLNLQKYQDYSTYRPTSQIFLTFPNAFLLLTFSPLLSFSTKPAILMDNYNLMSCFSTKPAILMDNSRKNICFSIKSALPMDKHTLFRKQFFDYGKIKLQNTSDLLIGSVIIEMQMSCSIDSLFRIKERYFADTIFLAYM